MVRKGMKPGETFEDGGRWFEVLAVNENGTYSSRQVVSGASGMPPPTDGDAAETSSLSRLTVTAPPQAEEPKAVRRGRKKKQ